MERGSCSSNKKRWKHCSVKEPKGWKCFEIERKVNVAHNYRDSKEDGRMYIEITSGLLANEPRRALK